MPALPPVLFPIKGVNRTFARSSQSDGTAFDMLNVLPFDRSGRLRGGQRPGTIKQITDALADKIVLLDQVTTLATASSASFTDAFGYASGNLETTASAVWSDSVATSLKTTGSNTVQSHGDAPGAGVAGYVGSPLTFTEPIIVTMTFSFPTTTYNAGTAPDGWSVAVYARANNATSPGAGPQLSLTGAVRSDGFFGATLEVFSLLDSDADSSASTIFFDGGDGSDLVNFPFLSFGTNYTLTLTIDGTTLTGTLEGGVFTSPVTVTDILSTVTPASDFGFSLGNTNATVGVATGSDFSINGGSGSSSGRVNNLIAAAGGNVYIGDLSTLPEATGGSAVLSATAIPQMSFSLGKAYFVDGSNLVQLDVVTKTIETYTASAGTTPTGCTLTCVYRDRLILAAPFPDTQNFFCSRVGDQHDWDFSQEDPAAAFAGNASVSGRIGEPITALIPASDDIMYIGGDHNLWAVRGDPADGGSIDMLSDAIGVLGPDAWCKTPDGIVYFVGSGGFFKLPAGGGQPQSVSQDKWSQFFSNIDRTTVRITLVWDRDNHGCFIFFMPNDGSSAATCLWYDERTDGFFPQAFPLGHGPFSTLVFDGDGPEDRVLLLGGQDDFLRSTNATATTDDASAIESYVVMGPYQIGDSVHDGVIEGVDITFGDPAPGLTTDDWAVTTVVRTGKDALSVTDGTPQHQFLKDFGALVGRVGTIRRRARGAWCSVKIGNETSGKHWSFESMALTAVPGGRTRR